MVHTHTHTHTRTRTRTVAIKQVQEVREGKSTDSFKQHGEAFRDDCSFSVIYLDRGKYKTLDLVALNPLDAKAWAQGLRTLAHQEGIPQSASFPGSPGRG